MFNRNPKSSETKGRHRFSFAMPILVGMALLLFAMLLPANNAYAVGEGESKVRLDFNSETEALTVVKDDSQELNLHEGFLNIKERVM